MILCVPRKEMMDEFESIFGRFQLFKILITMHGIMGFQYVFDTTMCRFEKVIGSWIGHAKDAGRDLGSTVCDVIFVIIFAFQLVTEIDEDGVPPSRVEGHPHNDIAMSAIVL